MGLNALVSSLGGVAGPFWSTLIGAVVGAVVGGVISYMIQRSGAHSARCERLLTKRQNDLAVAVQISVKTIRILSSIASIRYAIETANNRRVVDDNGAQQAFWQVMPPFGTFPPAINAFTGTENAFFVSTKNHALMFDAFELVDVFNDSVKMVQTYSERRATLTALFRPEEVNGGLVTSVLEAEQARLALPKIIELNALSTAMIERSRTDHAQARRVFDAFQSCCERQFRKDFPVVQVTDQMAMMPAPKSGAK